MTVNHMAVNHMTEDEPLRAEVIAAAGVVARVELHDEIGSTQDRAHELARGESVGPLPLLIAAERQTAGRGRGVNRWWTAPGSLAFSLVFDPADWQVPRQPVPERSLAIGVAIIDTVRPLVAAPQSVGLHWPNDVFVGSKKLAGILIDVLPDGRHIVGIGLNVNNDFAAAPEEVRARATSLRELTGKTFDRNRLLVELLSQVQAAVRESALAPEALGRRFDELCLQRGATLTVEAAGRRVVGRCAGIGMDGALLLETDAGWTKIYSGVLR